jgi:PAS domain S-box-containing protein
LVFETKTDCLSIMNTQATILIVDDDPRLLQSLQALLETQGHASDSCLTVREAKHCLDRRAFDLVLLDIRVGRENGFSVMEYLREHGRDTLVIIMTGYASTDSAIQALRNGAADYLKKPFEPDELLTTVNNTLSRKALVKENQQLNGKVEKLEVSTQNCHNLLRLMCDNVPDLIWAKDLEGRFLFANQAMCDKLIMCGNPEEALGKTDLFFAERERQAGYQHTFGETCVDSDAVIKEAKAPGRFLEDGLVRGSYLALDVYKAPFLDEQQAMIGTVGCGRDVTREKAIEKALQESEQKYRALYDNAPLPYQSLDAEGRFLDVNPAWLTTLGYERDEVIGWEFAAFLHPNCVPRFETLFARFKRCGSVQAMHFKVRHKDGRYLDVSYEGCTGYWSDGSFRQTYCVLKDITEQKRAEDKLHRLQKAESLGRMAAAIAHHYNNLLTGVIGNLELSLDEVAGGTPLAGDLEQALGSARRAANLSRQMLAYLGQSPGRNESLDFCVACRRHLPEIQANLSDETDFEFDMPVSGLPISGNQEQICQTLDNLLANAREAFDGDTGRITLRIAPVSPRDIPASNRFPADWQPRETDYACLEVSDEGCGITTEDMEKVFDPFFTTKFTGRGLGLPVVLGNVKNQQGCITVQSTPGQGSTFRVFVPLAPEAGEAGSTGPPETAPESEAGKTVLVVDDQEPVRKVARSMLERFGYTVLTARDGVEAVEIFKQHHEAIRLVISDLSMPRMNGWETLSALRTLRPDIPVILASGYDEARAMASKTEEQPQAFLPKPFMMQTLKQTLEQVLGDKGDE